MIEAKQERKLGIKKLRLDLQIKQQIHQLINQSISQ